MYVYMYIYVYIIYNLPVNAIVTLPHPRSRDSQGQETFILTTTVTECILEQQSMGAILVKKRTDFSSPRKVKIRLSTKTFSFMSNRKA